MKFQFIEEHRCDFRVEKMCDVLEVSRSGYYKWRSSPPSNQEIRRNLVATRVLHYYDESNGIYGSPKITHLIRSEGSDVSVKTVGRIMNGLGIRSRIARKFRVNTTNSNHSLPVAPNILNQDFSTSAPNQVWVADITYIRTAQGKMYLASLLDLFTRRIVGWKLSDRMTTDLVEAALEMACEQHKPGPGLIHHSDRGSQYASHEYRAKLKEHEMICSMSRRGNCYDNACIEAFHSILKRELVYQMRFKTKEQAQQEIYWFIEFWYNRRRIHSSLNYLSPERFESAYWLSCMEK